ncbi:MAG: glycosyltransferase family 39 protein, partial [Vicinamibacterales bacterium]
MIFVVALALRLLHVVQLRSSPFFDVLLGDSHGYDEWARRIAGGEWIGRDVFYQAPLYPYFLGVVYALVGRDLLLVRIVQAVLGAGASTLVGLAAARLFGMRAGLMAGLGLAFYAPAIFFDALLQKSVLDVFFVSLALWLMSRILTSSVGAASWIALGVAMGGLSLTRENTLVFVAVILLWAAFAGTAREQVESLPRRSSKPDDAERRRGGPRPGFSRFGTAGAFVIGLALVLLPVVARNYAVGGGLYLTTSQFGPNFYIGNNPHANGRYTPLRPGRSDTPEERKDATDLAQRATG